LDSTLPATRRSALTSLAALAFAALLAAPALADDVPLFKLTATDGKFEPDVIEVPAGKRVRLEVHNAGKTPMEFESKDLKQEKVIAPGAKASFTLRAMKAGEYRFFDEFHEKTGQGRIVAK
jgi:plastocyanin